MNRDNRTYCASMRRLAVNGLLLALVCAHAGKVPAVEYEADMYIDAFNLYESSEDLGTTPDGEVGEAGINARPRLYTRLSENWNSLISLQLFHATDLIELPADEGGGEAESFVGLRQLWLEWGGLTPYPGEALRVGRERLRLDDGLVLDTDIVSARWAWDTTLFKGGFGVAEELDTFRSDESELSAAEQNLRRNFITARWQYRYNAFLSGHAIQTDGRDNTVTAPQLIWTGVSVDNGYFDYRTQLPWQYYAAAYNVNGHETLNGREVDVAGWAVDGGLRWRSRGGVSVGAQFSSTDGETHGYRQTGLQSNRAYFTGARSRMHRFNEALRPEFRNMAVVTLYAGIFPGSSPWEFGVAGHSMYLRDPDGTFAASGYSSPTDGTDRDLGRAVDLIVSWYWEKNDSILSDDDGLDSYFRVLLSGFYPGEAFNAGGTDRQVNRGIIDWVVKF
jgi:alginate production protein